MPWLLYREYPPGGGGNQEEQKLSRLFWVPVGAKAFFDFTYGEVSIGYELAADNMYSTATTNGSSKSATVPFSLSSVVIQLLGKYPLKVGGLTLFPLGGFEKFICVSGSSGNVPFTSTDISDYSPLFLMAGAGADVPISKVLYLRAELTGAYSLASKRSDSYYTGVTYVGSSGWEIRFSVGIAYAFN